MSPEDRRETRRLRLTGVEPFDSDRDDSVTRFVGYTVLISALLVAVILWVDMLMNSPAMPPVELWP